MLKVQHEDKLISCMIIEFFLKEYAARKFLLDLKNGKVDFEKWIFCLVTLVRHILENVMIHEEQVEYNGEKVKFHDIIYSEKIYDIIEKYKSTISIALNNIIAYYHNRVTDDHRYILPVPYDMPELESQMQNIIDLCEMELKFLRDTCIEYGYYPFDLMWMSPALKLYKVFVTRGVPFINPFVRVCKKSQDYVYTNYILGTGLSFFEKENPGVYYFYINIEDGNDIENVINTVKITLSRMKKRNNKYSIVIHDQATTQLCICIDRKKFNLEDCLMRTRDALLKAVAFTKCYDVSDLDLFREALWHVLEGRNKKISYFNRLVGLHLWDMVFILNKNANSAIEELIESPHFGEMYRNHFGKDEKFELEPANLRRNYKLACDCIEALSILPHGR